MNEQVSSNTGNRVESAKLFYDFFKHITTLSTGTLIVLTALLDKLFESPVWMSLVVIVFVFLLISITTSLISMIYMAKHVQDRITGQELDSAAKYIGASIISFMLAIAALSIFATKKFMV